MKGNTMTETKKLMTPAQRRTWEAYRRIAREIRAAAKVNPR